MKRLLMRVWTFIDLLKTRYVDDSYSVEAYGWGRLKTIWILLRAAFQYRIYKGYDFQTSNQR